MSPCCSPHVVDLLGGQVHHTRRELDVLHVQVLLRARLVLRALGMYLLAHGGGAAKDAAECVEMPLNAHRHHSRHTSGRPSFFMQSLNAFTPSLSIEPSYKFSTRYFCALLVEDNFVTVMDIIVPSGLIHICIVSFINGLPVKLLA